jgi:hypothetical protein
MSNISHLNSPTLPFSFISHCPTPEIVSTDIISIYILVCTLFALYSPSFIISPTPPPSTGANPLRQDLFHHPVLQCCIRKEEEEEENDIFGYLRYIHREFLVAFPCVCIFIFSIFLLSTLIHFLWWF